MTGPRLFHLWLFLGIFFAAVTTDALVIAIVARWDAYRDRTRREWWRRV